MVADYPMTIAALMAAILVCIYAGIKVGQARGRFRVAVPHTTGHPIFERVFRAHQNTLEQFLSFLPLLGLVALFFGDRFAALYGGLWVIGRIWFIEGYARDAAKRVPGFMISALSTWLALLACAIALAMQLLA